MSELRHDDSARMIAMGLGGALILHALLVAGLLATPESTRVPTAIPNRIHMVRTQAGELSIGVVQTPTPPVPDVPAPRAADRPELATKAAPATSKTRPKNEPKLATVTPDAARSKTRSPTAGAGETGGKGSDLASVDLGGTDFPFPVYQRNIVNAIAQNFPRQNGAYRAEVLFVIRRDGSVDLDQVQVVTRSGNYVFDNAALGAVEAAANKKMFGPLPPGYRDDALTVIFKFDPSLIRP
jgi:outer membrane biosynthesis protein TonB